MIWQGIIPRLTVKSIFQIEVKSKSIVPHEIDVVQVVDSCCLRESDGLHVSQTVGGCVVTVVMYIRMANYRCTCEVEILSTILILLIIHL